MINNIHNQNNEFIMNLLKENQLNNIQKHPLLETNKAITEENYDLVKKMQKEMKKCEHIALKMIKGENITQKEFKFISYKYPQIKHMVDGSIQEKEQLKEVLKNCDTDTQLQQVLSKVIKNITYMIKKEQLSDIQIKIKMIVIEECKKQIKDINNENKNIEQIVSKLVRNKKLTLIEKEIINQDFPNIKKVLKESFDENNLLKDKLKLCKNEKEKKEVIAEVIKNIKDNSQKGVFSKIERIIKLELISLTNDNLKKESKQSKNVIFIAKKIVRGIKLSSSENRIIDEKYSEIKKFTKEILNEYETMKKEINLCGTDGKKQILLKEKIENIKSMESEELIFEIQEEIKKEIIDRIKELERNEDKENELNFYMNPYLYLLTCGLSSKVSIIILGTIIVSVLLFLLK